MLATGTVGVAVVGDAEGSIRALLDNSVFGSAGRFEDDAGSSDVAGGLNGCSGDAAAGLAAGVGAEAADAAGERGEECWAAGTVAAAATGEAPPTLLQIAAATAAT